MRGALFFILALSAMAAEAGKEDSLRSHYIQTYRDYFFVGPVVKKRDLSFDIHPVGGEDLTDAYRSNSGFSVGLALNLFDVGIEAAFSIPAGARSNATYGESTVSDVQLTAIGRQWFADAYRQSYEGFYLSNQKVSSGNPFPQRGDIETNNYGASFAYIFNHDQFSLRSAYTFTEAQLKSRGSFLISYILSTFTMRADSSLVASADWPSWGTGASFENVRFTSMGLAPGYSHNFVYRRFFLNMTLAIGPAHYWTRYELGESNSIRNDIRINAYSLGRVGIGYNGSAFFAGINVASQARDLRFENIRFNTSMSTVRVIAGFRFLERGVLKERAIDYAPF